MKRFILSFFCVLLLACSATAQSSKYKTWSDYVPGVSDPDAWYSVGSGPNFRTLIRPSSVKRRGNIVEFWEQTIFVPEWIEVGKRKWEVNCRTNEINLKSVMLYWIYEYDVGGSMRLLENRLLRYTFPDDKWSAIVPESIEEFHAKAVCTLR